MLLAKEIGGTKTRTTPAGLLALSSAVIIFVREQISTVQVMVLRQQYQALSQNGEEDSSQGSKDRGEC